MNRVYIPSWLNLLLGLLLWLGFFTDYSWDNVWANVCFAPVVGLVGLVTWVNSGKSANGNRQKWFTRAACVPSTIGGLPYFLLIIAAVIPPFLLATMFWSAEQAHATRIQQTVSPDGTRVAEVYFLPVGAYSGGNGRIEVHVKYAWLPFVKRDVFYLRVSHADETTTNYLQWLDNDTLHIGEKDCQLKLGIVKPDLPAIIVVPLNAVRLFGR